MMNRTITNIPASEIRILYCCLTGLSLGNNFFLLGHVRFPVQKILSVHQLESS